MLVFLFTDIEGSTRLWEQHPREMRTALARHDELLRDAVTSHEGRVVKTTGDGIMAVFASVDPCLTACLHAQRGLATATWETTQPIRVRMGVNVGEVEERDGDFFGNAVNRTARIMAAGHGGQVLLSGLVADLARNDLPAGIDLRDLGAHRLKDLTHPEHLYQLVHEDLESVFPALTTIDARPNNLPMQVTEFFGRQSELTSLRQLLEQPGVRLVTLTGPGGTGKTRLALQIAAEIAESYRDGLFFVDLAAEREPDAAFEAILRDLDLTSAREGSPLNVLKMKLRDRAMLIILDNFEQVTEAALGVSELLQNCPELKVVVTSRESLRLRGEHVFPVPPLSVPDPGAPIALIAASEAVSLFTERARSVKPDFAITEGNAAAIAEISARLDGLPLAIELAAARLKVFTPHDLLDRLRKRLDVLGAGARDLPTRQRTLRGTIEWSYELLSEDECRVFEVMSVFSTASLEAAEEVTNKVLGDVDLLDVLTSLVDKSLVRTAASGSSESFLMLRTIREYAGERLAMVPDLEAAARRAHAEFYSRYAIALLPSLEGSERKAALETLAAEIGNLRPAWRFWVEQGDLQHLYRLLDGLWALQDSKGWYHAAAELTSDLLGVLLASEASPERDQEEMTLRTSLARALMAARGYTVEVEAEFRRALELASSTGGAQNFPVLRALATYYMNIVEFSKVEELGQRILDAAQGEKDAAMAVDGHLVFGLGKAFSGDLDTGLRHLDLAIKLFEPEMHRSGRFRVGPSPGVVAPTASGLLLWQIGFPDQGIGRVADALSLARQLNHPYSLSYALYHSGYLDVNRGRWEQARQVSLELAEVAGEGQYSVWQALASVLNGVALCGMGDTDEGISLTEAGADLYEGLTTPPIFWPPLLGLRSFAFLLAGQPGRALELVDQAIAASAAKESAYPEFGVIRGDIISSLPSHDPAEVVAAYRSAIRGARIDGLRLIELAATTRLASLLPEDTQVKDDLRALYDTFTEGFDEPELKAARGLLEIDSA